MPIQSVFKPVGLQIFLYAIINRASRLFSRYYFPGKTLSRFLAFVVKFYKLKGFLDCCIVAYHLHQVQCHNCHGRQVSVRRLHSCKNRKSAVIVLMIQKPFLSLLFVIRVVSRTLKRNYSPNLRVYELFASAIYIIPKLAAFHLASSYQLRLFGNIFPKRQQAHHVCLMVCSYFRVHCDFKGCPFHVFSRRMKSKYSPLIEVIIQKRTIPGSLSPCSTSKHNACNQCKNTDFFSHSATSLYEDSSILS